MKLTIQVEYKVPEETGKAIDLLNEIENFLGNPSKTVKKKGWIKQKWEL